MKSLRLAIIAASLVLAVQAHANLYDFTFTQTAGPTTASGTIDVVTGSAISGFIDVLTGPNNGIYSLLPGSWFPSPSGAFQADNLVAPASDPFVSNNGLLFAGGGIEINLYSNGPGDYALWGWSAATGYDPIAEGTATLTQVPDGGMTLTFLGIALTGLAAARRKLSA